jgi:hypothetical protein
MKISLIFLNILHFWREIVVLVAKNFFNYCESQGSNHFIHVKKMKMTIANYGNG